MSRFSTPVEIPDPGFTLNYHSQSVLIGSCFTENIGQKLKKLKFPVSHNPFGVVYNPLSLAKQIDYLLHKESFTSEDLEMRNELYFSFMHYTLFSDPDPNTALQKINSAFQRAKALLPSARILFLTLGTSYVYHRKANEEIVANCHKLPASEFIRKMAGFSEITTALSDAIASIREINPSLHVVATVSPIRHWKDGAIQNQRSKANLILAVKELEESLPNFYYFPAYEIFMDELRDYRFYADDMLHPSDLAVEYIWSRFSETFFDEETQAIIRDVGKLIAGFNHRPRHSATNEYRKFRDALIRKADEMHNLYPFLSFTEEIEKLTNSV